MSLTRRRFLAISAAAFATGAPAAGVNRITFRALGADCRLTLPGDPEHARLAAEAVRAEIGRIERIFSLWQRGSELRRLNRTGRLASPSPDLVEACRLAARISRISVGAFDVTLQPVWQARAEGTAPDWTLVDWTGLVAGPDGIRFARPGMAATFNGVAQGLATDRAVAVLQGLGYRDVLANLGEFRGLGHRPDGTGWRIGVADPEGDTIVAEITLDAAAPAVATSAPRGTLVSGHPHIVDPRHRPGPRWRSVTVQANSAVLADALSTAVAAAPQAMADDILAGGGALSAVLQPVAGGLRRWSNGG